MQENLDLNMKNDIKHVIIMTLFICTRLNIQFKYSVDIYVAN